MAIFKELPALLKLPTLLRDEASVYFNVIMVESMTSGVMSIQHQCSIHDYNVLPVPFDTSFCFLPTSSILVLQSYSYLLENILPFNLVCHM